MSFKIKKNKQLKLPDISVIIPVKDSLQYLDKCLSSLQKTMGVEIEIIIVNDGSGPEVVHYLEQFPQLNVVHSSKSEGFISACHKGVQRAIGKHILFLNSDTEIIEPTSFRKMLNLFIKDPKVGVVGARLLLENNTIQHAGLVWDNTQMNFVHRYYGKDMNDPVVCQNEVIDIVTGACFMVSRELWNKVGGFEKIYSPGYFEDSDFCLKIKELGYITMYCGESSLYHYQSKSFTGGPTKEHFGRNHEIFKSRWIRTGKVCKYPKIAACYIVCNEEDYIEASIRSIYDFVSKIIIIDGTTEVTRSFGNVNGSSSDKTLEIIKNIQFNDPQNKITLITGKLWKDKNEQRNVYCDMLQGSDFAWIIDGDEVWDNENLRKVEQLIFANPQIPAFQFNFVDFWKDFGHRSRGIWEQFVGRKSLINLKLTGKIKYNIHTIPVTLGNEDIPSVFCQDIYFYHYSYVRTDERMKQKIDYYLKKGTPGFQTTENWYENIWLAWDKNKSEVEKIGTHLFGRGYTELWTGNHPEAIRTHPRYMEWLDRYKLKINFSLQPFQRDNFINISLKEKDIFNIDFKIDDVKPYIVLIEDLLEHLSFNTVGNFLVKVYDSMTIGGEVVIKLFNLIEVVKRYMENNMQYIDFVKVLYGNQEDNISYKACSYDSNSIKALLEDVGFSNIHVEYLDNNLFLYVTGRKDRELS